MNKVLQIDKNGINPMKPIYILNNEENLKLYKSDDFNQLMESVSRSWGEYLKTSMGDEPNTIFIPTEFKTKVESILKDNCEKTGIEIKELFECKIIYLDDLKTFSFAKLYWD